MRIYLVTPTIHRFRRGFILTGIVTTRLECILLYSKSRIFTEPKKIKLEKLVTTV